MTLAQIPTRPPARVQGQLLIFPSTVESADRHDDAAYLDSELPALPTAGSWAPTTSPASRASKVQRERDDLTVASRGAGARLGSSTAGWLSAPRGERRGLRPTDSLFTASRAPSLLEDVKLAHAHGLEKVGEEPRKQAESLRYEERIMATAWRSGRSTSNRDQRRPRVVVPPTVGLAPRSRSALLRAAGAIAVTRPCARWFASSKRDRC